MVDFSKEFSRREGEVLEIVLRLGEPTVNEVKAEMADPPTRAALRSILRILESKGHLKHRKLGREFLYKATVRKESAGRNALRGVLRTFFDGSLGDALAAHFSDPGGSIDAEEASKLEALIARLSQRTKSKPPKRPKP